MIKISDKDLENLKHSSENSEDVIYFNMATARSSAYLAIETIRQLRNNLRNSVFMVVLGVILGFLPTYITQYNEVKNTNQEINKLHVQVKKVQLQLIHFDKYHSKKDSL